MPKSMDVQLFKASLCLGTPVPRQKAIDPNYAQLPLTGSDAEVPFMILPRFC